MRITPKEYLKKNKTKKNKRSILILGIFIISIGLFVLLKAEIFNIVEVNVENNKILSKEDILDESNIFLVKLNELEDKILLNPYIEEVSIRRRIPNKISVIVNERVASYKIIEDNKSYILNDDLVIMEKREDLDGIVLPILEGVDIEGRELGDSVTKNKEKAEFLKLLKNALDTYDMKIDSVNVSDINNIYLYFDDCKVILGANNNIENKLTKAINILKSDKVNISNGYINVSFSGNPVIYEKQDANN